MALTILYRGRSRLSNVTAPFREQRAYDVPRIFEIARERRNTMLQTPVLRDGPHDRL
jgi:hypothetical protein